MRFRLAWLACGLSCLLPSRLLAQASEPSPSEFQSNDYAIDLFTGPVLGSARVVGMAGAFGAIATGIDGSMLNPAGYAERAESEIDAWEWELAGGIWFGGLFSNNDFDNDGSKKLEASDAIQLSVGGRLQIGSTGFGITATAQTYTLEEDGESTDVSLITYRFGIAYAFWSGGLVVGVAGRGLSLELSDTWANDQALITFDGLGGELGALLRPARERYRVGAAVRSAVSSKPESEGRAVTIDGVRQVRGFVLPEEVHAPWEVDMGFAYQFGERRSNVPWQNPHKLKRELKQRLAAGTYEPPPTHGGKPYPELSDDPAKALERAMENERESLRRFERHQPRKYVLLSSDLLISGKTEQGHGLQGFLAQEKEPSGRKVSVGVRVGVESEVMANRLKLRGGSYLEPSRFARGYYRPHGTLGSEVRLFDWWHWSFRASATIDLAPRYFDWGVSVGLWH